MTDSIPPAPPQPRDISTEEWREYEFGDGRIVYRIVYRIENPKTLYVGSTTHRVVDGSGVAHCVPAPGHQGCVLRWKANPPVSF
jgi:hypothetical protein